MDSGKQFFAPPIYCKSTQNLFFSIGPLPPVPRFPWSLISTTTSSPQWTHGIDSTPTISLSATTIQVQPKERWSARRSRGGGTTSPSLASRPRTGCCETSRHITGQWWSQGTTRVIMECNKSTAGAVVLIKVTQPTRFQCFLKGYESFQKMFCTMQQSVVCHFNRVLHVTAKINGLWV